MKRKTTRRAFIRGVGASAGALAFPSILSPLFHEKASAQSGGMPKRIVFVDFGDGGLYGHWEPRAASNEVGWSFGEAFSPLAEYLPETIGFSNLDMVSTYLDSTAPGNAHQAGSTHFLTGSGRLNSDSPGAASIDQYIARALSAQGVLTPLESLTLSIDASGPYNSGWTGTKSTSFTSAPGEFVGGWVIPHEVMEVVFPEAERDAGDPAAAAWQARMERIYAASAAEHRRIAPRLDGEGRRRVEEHLRMLEGAAQRGGGGDGSRASFWPDRSIVAPAEGLNWTYNAPRETTWVERYNTAHPINMRLAAAALHADRTRVLNLDMAHPPSHAYGYENGMFNSTDSHDLTHKLNSRDANSQNSNPDAVEIILEQKRVMCRMIKVFLDELRDRREPDGSRLLDHTLVVFVSHIGDGSHTRRNLAWFTIGGLNGRLRTGQHIAFADDIAYEGRSGGLGRAHNDLFVSLLNAMDIPDTTFGNESVCTGPIREMFT